MIFLLLLLLLYNTRWTCPICWENSYECEAIKNEKIVNIYKYRELDPSVEINYKDENLANTALSAQTYRAKDIRRAGRVRTFY